MNKQKLSESLDLLKKAQNIVKVEWEKELSRERDLNPNDDAIMFDRAQNIRRTEEELILSDIMGSISDATGQITDLVEG